MLRQIVSAVLVCLSLALLAAPAPWYRWSSEVDGKVVCAQTSPGAGWVRLPGAYRDVHCRHALRG
ncbi:MAG: hypothetical protein EPO06_10960 [Burkholderiaceae bacterium]|nr:MAG: hypothetical protein EPO06_10960 [Burkholderiaceae bacterium]